MGSVDTGKNRPFALIDKESTILPFLRHVHDEYWEYLMVGNKIVLTWLNIFDYYIETKFCNLAIRNGPLLHPPRFLFAQGR